MGTAELAVMLGARRPLLPPPRAGPVGVTLSAATRNAVPLCSPRKTGPRVEGPGGRDCDGNEKVCPVHSHPFLYSGRSPGAKNLMLIQRLL